MKRKETWNEMILNIKKEKRIQNDNSMFAYST